MKTWIKRVVSGVVGLGLAGLVAYAYAPKPLPVETALVDRGKLRVEVEADGQTRVKHRFIVSAPLAGIVARPELRAGDSIKQGDALVTITPIDPPLLDARSRAQAEAQVKLSRAAQAQAEARVALARTALEYAKTDVGRQRELAKTGTIAKASLEAAELAEKTSEQEFAAAKLGVEVARFQVQAAEAALVRASGGASAGQGGAALHAPVTGKILRVLQQDGGVVPAGAPLFEIGDASDLEIVIDLLSTDAVKVKPGAFVSIERWGGEGALEAKVRVIEPAGFTKVSALGIEEQRVNVIADFSGEPKTRALLGDGYRVEAKVVLSEESDALRVPVSALFRAEDAWAVYTIEGELTKETRVVLGQRNRSHAAVLEGLAEGSRVVVHPSDQLKDGVRVIPHAAPARAELP